MFKVDLPEDTGPTWKEEKAADYAALEQRVKELEIENNLLIKGLFESEELTTLRADNKRLREVHKHLIEEMGYARSCVIAFDGEGALSDRMQRSITDAKMGGGE
jgi:hypothetical protein